MQHSSEDDCKEEGEMCQAGRDEIWNETFALISFGEKREEEKKSR